MNFPQTSGQRLRPCRACGRKFEYPVKGNPATRHHCADCVVIPADVRSVIERLNTRVGQLENQLRRLQDKPAGPPNSGAA